MNVIIESRNGEERIFIFMQEEQAFDGGQNE